MKTIMQLDDKLLCAIEHLSLLQFIWCIRLHEFFIIQNKNMAIIKVIEIMSNSNKSWEDAAQQAVLEASKTIKNIRSIYVKEHSATVNKNNKLEEYRITANLSFEVETPSKGVSKK